MKDWQSALGVYLENPNLRIAFIGIGNQRMGDDALGGILAEDLQANLQSERFRILDGGLAPENCLGALRNFQPHLVVLLDVVVGMGDAGTIHWLRHDKCEGFSASSHSLPLGILAAFLEAEYGCAVYVLAVTAESLNEEAALSNSVEKAASEIRDYLLRFNAS